MQPLYFLAAVAAEENNQRIPINLKLAPTGNEPREDRAMLKIPFGVGEKN